MRARADPALFHASLDTAANSHIVKAGSACSLVTSLKAAVVRNSRVPVWTGRRCEADASEDECDECPDELQDPERDEDFLRPYGFWEMLSFAVGHVLGIDRRKVSMVVWS